MANGLNYSYANHTVQYGASPRYGTGKHPGLAGPTNTGQGAPWRPPQRIDHQETCTEVSKEYELRPMRLRREKSLRTTGRELLTPKTWPREVPPLPSLPRPQPKKPTVGYRAMFQILHTGIQSSDQCFRSDLECGEWPQFADAMMARDHF